MLNTNRGNSQSPATCLNIHIIQWVLISIKRTEQILYFVLNLNVFRVAQFEGCLRSEVVSLASLKELCYRGVPEGGGRRALAWRILLGYLPLKRSLWPEVVREKRALYRQLVQEMIVTTPEERGDISPGVEDHPLNLNPTSHWQSFFKDNEVSL